MKWSRAAAVVACLALWAVPAGASAAASNAPSDAQTLHVGNPSLGPNVLIFSPSMPQASIQAKLNAIAAQQVSNQFGPQRYAILFEPGTYGSATDPLNFQVGYYTSVAGLGATPQDVVINGSIDSYNQCIAGSCTALDNFWRSMSNLTINVTKPGAGCYSNEFWAVSQASPMRRVVINGSTTLMDYCSGPSFASGGFIADSQFNGGVVINGSQQQWLVRNSSLNNGWTNGVWNQVFLGDTGAPATDFAPGTNQYTNVASTPVSQEEPFLYTDSSGAMRVFVPSLLHNSVGPSFASGPTAGTSLPISQFFVADPTTPVPTINAALSRGLNLILTPGVYDLPQTIVVSHPDTIVLGLGFATLIPQNGNVALRTADVPGIKLSGLIIDAGPQNSPSLLQLGGRADGSPLPGLGGSSDPNDPTLVQDVFLRVGGAEPGRTTTAMIVDDNNTILDDIWAWRADHGYGVGWTQNTADTGLIVNGNDVHAYGLAVEHFQKNEVIWNGQNGEDVFFQNEMPYDPPSQAAWMASPTQLGYPAFLVGSGVKTFQGYGMGSYSFFDQGVPIYASNAFEAPDTPGVQFHDLLTIFLDAVHGQGGILNVINGTGGSSTATNADTPVDVTTYP